MELSQCVSLLSLFVTIADRELRWIIVLFSSVGPTGDMPIPLVRVDGHLLGPPLLPPCHNPSVVPPQRPLIPGQPGSDNFSADDHSVHTPLHSATDHLSAGDASVIPSSRRSSRRSLSVKTMSPQTMNQLYHQRNFR